MMVRKVVGPFYDWPSFAQACPVLDSFILGGWSYAGDPYNDWGRAVRVGEWRGHVGVFEAWPMDGWRLVYVGLPTQCGTLSVEPVIVLGPEPGDAIFYWQTAARYAVRLDSSHFATGNPDF